MAYTAAMLLPRLAALSPFQRSAASAVAALVFYGGWAYLVNNMHGQAAALKAAGVQGSYSLLLTFVMTMLVESMYAFFARFISQPLLQKWLSIIMICAIIFSTSWWVNALAGTPEIFNTVILGYIIGGTYTVIYVYGLARLASVNGAR